MRSTSSSPRSEAHADEPALARTWHEQLIELTLPGIGAITVLPAGADRTEEHLAERDRIALEHTWLVLPALGPVVPTDLPEGSFVADVSGRVPAQEIRPRRPEGTEPILSTWLRLPQVRAALSPRGAITGVGALVGSDRAWFEPAVAVRADTLLPGPSDAPHPVDAEAPGLSGPSISAVDRALQVARGTGQAAVLRISEGTLDVIPTGIDPRVPRVETLGITVLSRPRGCPVTGAAQGQVCRPYGGPWVRAAMRAQATWEARRSLAVGLLGCDTCCGQALRSAPPAPAGTPLSPKLNPPRLGPVRELEALDRLVLRSGEVVRIDPMRGDSDDGPGQVLTIGGRP